MPADLPSPIRVACFDIEVVVLTQHDAALEQKFATFTALKQQIAVDISTTRWKQLDSLFHELTHAIFWAYTIKEKDNEERIASMMGTAWAQIWRDNPELLRWVAGVAWQGATAASG